MKKIIIVLACAMLTAFLALFFIVAPEQIISKINIAQKAVVLRAEKSGGNFLTGYFFTNISLFGNNGAKLLSLEEVLVDLRFLPLFSGRIGIDLKSKYIIAAFMAGIDGSISGEAKFTGLPFDSAAYIQPENIAFTAPISGRVSMSGRKADFEVKAEAITWKRFSVSDFALPSDICEKGRGGVSVDKGSIIVKSLACEGSRGYSRISGEINSGQRRLMLELFPKDWDDFMLLPLKRYKVTPGHYKIPLNL